MSSTKKNRKLTSSIIGVALAVATVAMAVVLTVALLVTTITKKESTVGSYNKASSSGEYFIHAFQDTFRLVILD